MPAEQLLLDVDGPLQAVPRRDRARSRLLVDATATDRQIEFILAAPKPAGFPPPVTEVLPAAPTIPSEQQPFAPEISAVERQPFAVWLLSQTNRRGSLCELARAAKLDRLFPRSGSADDVRARFSLAGADGEAFEALEDAEREYERSCSVPA